MESVGSVGNAFWFRPGDLGSILRLRSLVLSSSSDAFYDVNKKPRPQDITSNRPVTLTILETGLWLSAALFM